jgi:protein TonB
MKTNQNSSLNMKNLLIYEEAGTFEDFIFENRNKLYGAYALVQKTNKSLLLALGCSLLCAAVLIAIPFIRILSHPSLLNELPKLQRTFVIQDSLDAVPPEQFIPEPPRPSKHLEEKAIYAIPEVVNEVTAQVVFSNEPKESTPENSSSGGEVATFIPLDPIDRSGGTYRTYLNPEEPAGFMGGDVGEFRIWLSKRIKYPRKAIEHEVFGMVVVEFCVDTLGKLFNINLVRRLDPSVDEEVMRVMLSSPLWNPAKQGGYPVIQRFALPLVFQMPEMTTR